MLRLRPKSCSQSTANSTWLTGFSFTVGPGEVAVLVGPNGSGKTTTMDMIAGLCRPTSGQAHRGNTPAIPGGPHRVLLGVQLQTSGTPANLTARELLAAPACLYQQPRRWQPLATTLHVTDHLHRPVDELFGGQRRKLDVIAACIGTPKVPLLDEPTSGVDPEGRAHRWVFIQDMAAEGMAVLTSTHDMAGAETYADTVLLLTDGTVKATGPVAHVLPECGGTWRPRVEGLTDTAVALVRSAATTII